MLQRTSGNIVPFDVWLGFVGVALLFMATPGPSHLLMVTNTLSSGWPRSAATAVGDLSANAIQMLCAGLGISAVLATFPSATPVILLIGAAYIAWLGVQKLRATAASAHTDSHTAPASAHQLWLQGFMTSMTNPKAIIFFAAFFPPFVRADRYALDWTLLSVTYIVVDGMFLIGYGLLAQRLARAATSGQRVTMERVCGAALVVVAIVVAVSAIRQAVMLAPV